MGNAELITAFVTLFVVVDPIGLVPLFLALTQGMDARMRRAVGLRALAIATVLLTLFGLFGDALLRGIGISMPAFRIAGGVLLFLTALDMLFERRTQRREGQSAEPHAPDPSVFPLATPLLAGPGAMATMILLAGSGTGTVHLLAVHGVMLAVLACVFVLFLLATPLERALGRTGTMVVTRLLGMLLAALAVQFILDGLIGAGLFTAP
ncbi:MarC family transcriptional regulator [Rhodobacter sp. TJ_12]|uniref:MarC family protein n=1 Tax=Rhodobacter sp. TJ_12 TaxID=2029399 RepID=UPI001CC1020C|nr:MarC family protein [Rhodobacter sp. TJ_12]MBZ4023929.1 MarC family transcriptional regulator [Rhodobacter sp. TJ_12]